MEIAIGNGDRLISTIRRDGRLGIILAKSEKHPIGEFDSREEKEYTPKDDDVVIWIDNLESGRILQDTLGLALLKIQNVPLV